jgi:hypothetical protein
MDVFGGPGNRPLFLCLHRRQDRRRYAFLYARSSISTTCITPGCTWPLNGLRGIPGIEDLDSKANEVLHIPSDECEVVMKGCSNVNPCCFAVAAKCPQRSAMASVTGNMRPANHERTSISSQPCNAVRLWLTGSAAMPLQISPIVMTLRNALPLSALLRNADTRASGFSRVSSEGILVSTKYPFTG